MTLSIFSRAPKFPQPKKTIVIFELMFRKNFLLVILSIFLQNLQRRVECGVEGLVDLQNSLNIGLNLEIITIITIDKSKQFRFSKLEMF